MGNIREILVERILNVGGSKLNGGFQYSELVDVGVFLNLYNILVCVDFEIILKDIFKVCVNVKVYVGYLDFCFYV